MKIWQQNLRKSNGAWEHLLRNLDPEVYDIACIQEPFLNPVNLVNASNLRQFWYIVYPTDHHTTPTRSQMIMLVNKRLSKNNWHIVPIKSPNVMAVELMGNFGKVRIYNIYNPCNSNNMIQFLERHMQSENNARRNRQVAQGNKPEQREHIVWMGNFNHHHPMWELHSNVHLLTAANLDATGELINLLSLYNLVQVLPPNIATLKVSNMKNLTHPDNVFCTADFEQSFTQCYVVQDLRPVIMDHFPIISTIELTPERTKTSPKCNFRSTNWDKFRKTLTIKLNAIPPAEELNSLEQFNEAYKALTRCLTETVGESVPLTKPSPYAKHWWSKELDIECKAVHKLGRIAKKRAERRLDPIHEMYRIARNKFTESIKRVKENHWKEWLEELTLTEAWSFHRYAANDPTDQIHTRIKTLQDPNEENGTAATQDNARKSEILYSVFFRPPLEMIM